MHIFLKVILMILVFLAVSSGITKMILRLQDVEFFGKYGFTDTILIIYGAIQFIGGVLLIFEKVRFIGATMVAITFLISAVVLIMENNIIVAIITIFMVAMLGIIMKQSLKKEIKK